MNGIHRIAESETAGMMWARWEIEGASLSTRKAELALMRLEIHVDRVAEEAKVNVANAFHEARIRAAERWYEQAVAHVYRKAAL